MIIAIVIAIFVYILALLSIRAIEREDILMLLKDKKLLKYLQNTTG